MVNEVRLDGEYEMDITDHLQAMAEENKIHKHFDYWHLVTAESENRRLNPRRRTTKNKTANPWVWYLMLPDNANFRRDIQRKIRPDLIEVWEAINSLYLNKRGFIVGERIAGPMTEEEGRYIAMINERLNTFCKDDNNG